MHNFGPNAPCLISKKLFDWILQGKHGKIKFQIGVQSVLFSQTICIFVHPSSYPLAEYPTRCPYQVPVICHLFPVKTTLLLYHCHSLILCKISGNTFHPLDTGQILNVLNPLSASLTKWPNTLKQFAGKLPINCLSVFNHFAGLALKGLRPL